MATAVKRLDLTVGELVEIAGRRYEVVPGLFDVDVDAEEQERPKDDGQQR